MLQSQVITSNSLSLEHYYLCNYLPRTIRRDEMSTSLLRFKSRLQIDLQAWIECSIAEMASILMRPLIIVRPLHNNESFATLSGLDDLGVEMAQRLHCEYHPDLAFKTRTTRPLKALRKADRIAELENVYQFRSKKLSSHSYLVIDDILTTGTTAFSIAHAIINSDPEAKVNIFTLAKVDYDTQLNDHVSFYNEYYRWQSKEGWKVNEEQAHYNELQNLKNRIITDSF